jgi:hypothetical protein
MALPTDLDTLLTRAALADALTKAGYPTARATLATRATRGGGPPYRLFGRVPLYRWGDALAWVQSRLGPLIRSTSEADFPRVGRLTEANAAALARVIEQAGKAEPGKAP